MRKRILTILAAMALFGTLIAPAYGWNDYGHMMVAYLTYKQLTPEAKARVNTLLRLNPQYSEWEKRVPAGTPEADKQMMMFMFAATWPDKIKGIDAYKDDGTARGNRPDGASSSQNTGYSDMLRHKYWHFVDVPFTRDGAALPPIPTPNAEERIGVFRATLASEADDGLKSYDLVWLLHIVGDIHQPLHATTRVSSQQPDGDDGGNKEKVCAPTCGMRLHWFWDDALGKSESVTDVIEAGKHYKRAKGREAKETRESQWVKESFELAQKYVYTGPVQAGDGPFTLTKKYEKNAAKVARKQAALAGARLSRVLNTEMK